jgi:hypothetical protein
VGGMRRDRPRALAGPAVPKRDRDRMLLVPNREMFRGAITCRVLRAGCCLPREVTLRTAAARIRPGRMEIRAVMANRRGVAATDVQATAVDRLTAVRVEDPRTVVATQDEALQHRAGENQRRVVRAGVGLTVAAVHRVRTEVPAEAVDIAEAAEEATDTGKITL